jgi:hypothetical protein
VVDRELLQRLGRCAGLNLVSFASLSLGSDCFDDASTRSRFAQALDLDLQTTTVVELAPSRSLNSSK